MAEGVERSWPDWLCDSRFAFSIGAPRPAVELHSHPMDIDLIRCANWRKGWDYPASLALRFTLRLLDWRSAPAVELRPHPTEAFL